MANLRVQYTEEIVNTPPPGMDGWRFYRVEYIGADGHEVATGRLWLPAGTEPDAAPNGLRVAELLGEVDALTDAIIDAISGLNLSENGGDVTEVTYALNEAIGSPFQADEETGKLVTDPNDR